MKKTKTNKNNPAPEAPVSWPQEARLTAQATDLLLADGQANEADTLDGLAPQEPQLLLDCVLNNVLQGRHK